MLRRHRSRAWQPVTALATVAAPVALAFAAAALILLAPASASAAGRSASHAEGGSGLHVDPASPVAKAYALPLDGVRAESADQGVGDAAGAGGSAGAGGPAGAGGGDGAAGAGAEQTANLFGAGITRAPRRAQPGRRATATLAAYLSADGGSSSGLAWMAGAAAAVLALGGTGALILRRRR